MSNKIYISQIRFSPEIKKNHENKVHCSFIERYNEIDWNRATIVMGKKI